MALTRLGPINNIISGTLGVANGGTGLASGTSGQFLKFTGSTTVASAAGSGITMVDQWRYTTTTQGNVSPITSNLERIDGTAQGTFGSSLMSESSGIFGAIAGSTGAMQQLSALPTIMCFRGSHSFHEFTIFTISNLFYQIK